MNRIVHGGLLIAGLTLGLACDTGQPTAPSPVPTQPTVTEPRPQPPKGLAVGEPVATYVFSGPLDYAVSGFTPGSRYLFYEDGVFELRYDAFPQAYTGRAYQQEDATITFWFDGEWTWDHGFATGTLNGDVLEVRYSEIMQHSDFENAVYQRSP